MTHKLTEISLIEIQPLQGSKILLALCHNPHPRHIGTFVEEIDRLLVKYTKLYNHICWLGDFNAPDIKWDNSPLSKSKDQNLFCEMLDSFGLVQLNRVSSNQIGNILDLVITNCPLLSDVEKCIVDFQSEHAVLQFQIKAKAKKMKSTKQWVYYFKRADVEFFIKQLLSVDSETIVQFAPDIDAALSEWLSHINKVIENNVPKRLINHSRGPGGS